MLKRGIIDNLSGDSKKWDSRAERGSASDRRAVDADERHDSH